MTGYQSSKAKVGLPSVAKYENERNWVRGNPGTEVIGRSAIEYSLLPQYAD